MIDYNKPILIFVGNLLYHGVSLSVSNGKLRVTGDNAKLSPVYRQEIVRRKEQLLELLSPEVPEPLQPYFGRLLRVDELVEALGIAEQLDANLQSTPVNGGWLITIGKGPRPTVKERKAK